MSRENVDRALAAQDLVRRDGNRYVLLDDVRLRRQVARDWPVLGRRDRRSFP